MAMKVKLLKPHTHAGVDYVEGDEIEVEDSDVTFLKEQKVIAETAPSRTFSAAE